MVAILLIGVVGLVENQRVETVTDEALNYDVELEDQGDDLRIAILDVRHYHRNLVFAGTSRGGVADFEEAYAELQRQIDALENLGVRRTEAPQPEEFRQMAEDYYADFSTAIGLSESDPSAFTEASD